MVAYENSQIKFVKGLFLQIDLQLLIPGHKHNGPFNCGLKTKAAKHTTTKLYLSSKRMMLIDRILLLVFIGLFVFTYISL